jgi:EAL domain-containing protein (putative c-di-GMP-specific phosphodiesterase class I)
LRLKALGVQFSIDDFGTGYSSLGYLHRLPIDTLKIDQSFISRIDTDDESSRIVETITTLAYNLGMSVTAEGVETAEQLARLRALECDNGQGYYFSKPADSKTVEALISAQPHW